MKTINDYAELVKEKHALNKTIAPVETDLTDASREYHIGEQFIINGGLFKAKTEIAQHDALVLNTNYEPADPISSQFQTLTQKTDNLDDVISENGAKNLLPNRGKNATQQNVVATYNSDGTITLNNTAANDTDFTVVDIAMPIKLPVGTYKLSGANKSVNSWIYVRKVSVFERIATDTGDGVEFTIDSTLASEGIAVYVRVLNGTAYNNTVIKPMITLASQPNSDYAHYVPYAMTNRELTENISGKYIFAQWDKWIQVTADGTKTLGTLFKELADAIVAYAQTMPSGDEMTLQYIAADGYSTRPTITKISNSATSLTNVSEGLIVASNGAASLVRNAISTTLASCGQVVTSISPDGTVTVTPRTTNIPASGTLIVVRASIYHKIA